MSPLAAECTNVEAAAIQRDFDRRIIDFRIVGNDNDGRVRIGADLFERFVQDYERKIPALLTERGTGTRAGGEN